MYYNSVLLFLILALLANAIGRPSSEHLNPSAEYDEQQFFSSEESIIKPTTQSTAKNQIHTDFHFYLWPIGVFPPPTSLSNNEEKRINPELGGEALTERFKPPASQDVSFESDSISKDTVTENLDLTIEDLDTSSTYNSGGIPIIVTQKVFEPEDLPTESTTSATEDDADIENSIGPTLETREDLSSSKTSEEDSDDEEPPIPAPETSEDLPSPETTEGVSSSNTSEEDYDERPPVPAPKTTEGVSSSNTSEEDYDEKPPVPAPETSEDVQSPETTERVSSSDTSEDDPSFETSEFSSESDSMSSEGPVTEKDNGWLSSLLRAKQRYPPLFINNILSDGIMKMLI